MRLVVWNVRGGAQPETLSALHSLVPDVAVLVDCRPHNAARIVREARPLGYAYSLFNSRVEFTGLLLLSTRLLRWGDVQPEPIPGLWLHAVSDYWDLELGAVYGPLPHRGIHKGRTPDFWNWLLETSDRLFDRPSAICGVLNTGNPELDSTDELAFGRGDSYSSIMQRGWRDAFRERNGSTREYSWWSRDNGFRIDHCLLSPQAASPTSVRYVQEVAGFTLAVPPSHPARKSEISDHAALVVEL